MHVVDPSDGRPELVALHPRSGEGGLGAGVPLLPLVLEAHLPRVRGGREGAATKKTRNEKQEQAGERRTNRTKRNFYEKLRQKRLEKTGNKKKRKTKNKTPVKDGESHGEGTFKTYAGRS